MREKAEGEAVMAATMDGLEDEFDSTSQAKPVTANNVGPCVMCGNPVFQKTDCFVCSRVADGGCNFTMAIPEIKLAVAGNIPKPLHEALLYSDEEIRDLMNGLLCSREKQTVTWHDLDGSIFEYYEMLLLKNDADQWMLQITRDDEELAEVARENFRRIYDI
ncbi:hypothetical protein GMSM_42710 [Geomonas sp. Red276]